jgi:hypothetical protein
MVAGEDARAPRVGCKTKSRSFFSKSRSFFQNLVRFFQNLVRFFQNLVRFFVAHADLKILSTTEGTD